MAHVHNEAAEAILDREFKVLDHGFVRLVDYLGGDARIVQAARVSYGAGTKTVRQDRGLINYLMRNHHTSPFEQVIFTFHVKLPIFVARQWIRHRTARLNEISGRYSVMEDEFYLPQAADVRRQSEDNKQGRGEELSPQAQADFIDQLRLEQQGLYQGYQNALERDVARELARVNLPLSLYTQWYWQIDLHNLFHFLRLRLDDHAQLEIRRYGEVMSEIVRAVVPLAYAAFEEHVLYARTLSRSQWERVEAILHEQAKESEGVAELLRDLEKR